MQSSHEYIFGFAGGDPPIRALYKRELFLFDQFLSRIFTEEQYRYWRYTKDVRIAVRTVLDASGI